MAGAAEGMEETISKTEVVLVRPVIVAVDTEFLQKLRNCVGTLVRYGLGGSLTAGYIQRIIARRWKDFGNVDDSVVIYCEALR